MSRIVDLTLDLTKCPNFPAVVKPYVVPLKILGGDFRGMCYKLAMDGMSGTYLDFPGHIAEFDDGMHAGNYPLEKLFMLETTVIHLERDCARREVAADELDASGVTFRGKVLIIHALGQKSCHDFDQQSIPYFGKGAIRWIVERRPEIFVSDIYEKRPDQQGIFVELFRNRISAVCCPVNLDKLRATYSKMCVIPLRIDGATQVPCRLFVVED